MTELFRSFLVILEEGSLNRAALRLHVGQSSLTRQMQALENEIGAPLLERMTSGVKPTALGNRVAAEMKPLLESYDAAMTGFRQHARGQRDELRIGYLGSAAHTYLNPALAALRREHPQAKIRLLDQTPGEQMQALEKGEIDIALIGQEGASLAKEFYTRKLATLGACVVLPADHPLARKSEVHAAELKSEVFIGAPEEAVPGRNRWVERICRKGGFRPKFVAEGDSIGEAFSLVVSEGAVMILPDYFASHPPPGTRLLPLVDKSANWDLLLVWQRGRATTVLRSMVALLSLNADEHGTGKRRARS